MSAIITSNTDSPEAVASAMSDLAAAGKEAVEKTVPAQKAGETTTTSETVEDEDEIETEEDLEDDEKDDEIQAKTDGDKKPKNGVKKRFAKLTAKLSAKDQEIARKAQEADYWRQEALKSQKPGDAKKDLDQKDVVAAGKPKSDDFDSHDDYIEALTNWKMDERDKAREAEVRKTQVKTEFEKRITSHGDRVKTFKATREDFDDVIEDASDINVSIAIQEVIVDSDNGPELMYELCKNKEEFKRINALSPIAAARELGRFESKFLKTKEPSTEVKVSKAPAPVKPVGSNARSSAKKSLDDPNLTQKEFEKLREEQLSQRA